MTILILAPDSDTHAQAVVGHARVMGREPEVVDLSIFPQQGRVDIGYGSDGGRAFELNLPDRRIDLTGVGAAWWRRPQQPAPSEDIANERHRLFAANECQEALAGLWHALDAFWVNDPIRDQVAHRKVTQLRVAQDVGLTIPETCITNDPDQARRFIDRLGHEKVVYKAFSAFEDVWRETRVLKADELEQLDNVAYAPVIFQEYVEADYDIRLTVIGDQLFPAAIYARETAYPTDCRMDIGNARIEPVEIPERVQGQILDLMGQLGLHYGAIDLRKRSADGQLVFLEINPAGQWLFIEERTGQPISRAMADYLIRHDPPRPCPPCTQRESLLSTSG